MPVRSEPVACASATAASLAEIVSRAVNRPETLYRRPVIRPTTFGWTEVAWRVATTMAFGLSRGISVIAVSTFSVLAGGNSPCASLAARTCPVLASAITYAAAGTLGSGCAPLAGEPTTTPLLASRAPPTSSRDGRPATAAPAGSVPRTGFAAVTASAAIPARATASLRAAGLIRIPNPQHAPVRPGSNSSQHAIAPGRGCPKSGPASRAVIIPLQPVRHARWRPSPLPARTSAGTLPPVNAAPPGCCGARPGLIWPYDAHIGVRAAHRTGLRAQGTAKFPSGKRPGRARRVPVHPRRVPDHVRHQALDDAAVRRLPPRGGLQPPLPPADRGRNHGPVGRLRPADPDGL